MKIAFLTCLFPPKWLAGTEIATHYLAEHLALRGHEVHVITSLDEGLPEVSFENNYYVHRLPKNDIRFVGQLIFLADLVGTIKKIRPDIVHAQSLIVGMPAYISKRILKYPYVVWSQGSDVYIPDRFTKLTSKIIIKNADSAIALTGDMKRAMQLIYDRDITVIPNGIKLEEYRNKKPTQRHDNKRILFVGRLHKVKGVRDLLYAMQTVHQKLPEVKLILVGDGEERHCLEDLTDNLGIRANVEFVGRVPHERVQEYMEIADVFVLSSLSEGFPVTVLEAMACGLPIVATRVGGLQEIINEGINGYLIEPRKPDEIADRLVLLLTDEVMRKRISGNNREKAKMFSWDRIAKILESMYTDDLAQNMKERETNP